jgi:hypothetical protein
MSKAPKKSGFSSENSPEKWAPTKRALSRILGVTRRTLDAWLLLLEAPPHRDGDAFEIAPWLAFATERRAGNVADGPQLRLQKLRQEVELNEIKIMREAGQVLPLEMARGWIQDWVLRVRGAIYSYDDLTLDQKNVLADRIDAIDRDDYLKRLRGQSAEEAIA